MVFVQNGLMYEFIVFAEGDKPFVYKKRPPKLQHKNLIVNRNVVSGKLIFFELYLVLVVPRGLDTLAKACGDKKNRRKPEAFTHFL